MKYYKTTEKKHLNTFSVKYDYQITSSLILHASSNGKVWWRVDTDVQHRLFDRMVNEKSGKFTGTASIIRVYP